jgi:hypothetical protein
VADTTGFFGAGGADDVREVRETPGVTDKRAIDINWQQTAAGSLAAVSTAVLLSRVGVAGTLIGAALGSVVATTASAVYNHYLGRSREGLLAAREAALEKARRARVGAPETGAVTPPDLSEAEEELRRVEEEIAEAHLDESAADGDGAGSRFAWVPWRRVGLASAGLFGIVMAAILVFELVVDRPVASFTGGTDSSARGTTLGSTRSGDDTADDSEQDDGGGGSGSLDTPTSTPTAEATDTGSEEDEDGTSESTSDPTDDSTATAPDEDPTATTSEPTTASEPTTTQPAAGTGALATPAPTVAP